MEYIALDNPVFIVDAPRSGTTWLQLLLSQHPMIASCNETHLFSSYLSSLFKAWPAFHYNKRAIGIHHLMSEDEYFKAIREFSDKVMKKIVATESNSNVVLEKTPAHGRCWTAIVKVYPDARFIHLVRDPRSVVCSLRRAGRGWGKAWADPGLISNARLWVQDVCSASQLIGEGYSCYQLTYETLLENPTIELKRLFNFLGLSVDEWEPDDYVRKCEKDQLMNDRQIPSSARPWDTAAEPRGFFGRGGMANWKEELQNWEVALIEDLTFPVAEAYGYERTVTKKKFHARLILYSALEAAVKSINWKIERVISRL